MTLVNKVIKAVVDGANFLTNLSYHREYNLLLVLVVMFLHCTFGVL